MESLIFLPPGCTTASLFILITGYASSPALAVAFLTIGVGITGLNASGYAVNILDIAPQYAGVIMGVTNVFGASPGFISPQIVGIVTPNKVIRNLFIYCLMNTKIRLTTMQLLSNSVTTSVFCKTKNPKKAFNYLFSTGKRKIISKIYFETAIHTGRKYFHVHFMCFYNIKVMESYDGKKHRLEKDELTINYFLCSTYIS